MATHNLEVTTDNLLSVVAQMPDKEFQRFIENAQKKRFESQTLIWTPAEIKLIKQINECVLPAEKQNRVDSLVQRRVDAKISLDEIEELEVLNEESEELNFKRLELLAKLAKSAKQSLDEVMQRLEIRPRSVR